MVWVCVFILVCGCGLMLFDDYLGLVVCCLFCDWFVFCVVGLYSILALICLTCGLWFLVLVYFACLG